METVGIRELRQYATRVLARVRSGEVVGVTERGALIAKIAPVNSDSWGQLVSIGLLSEAQRPALLADITPLPCPALTGSQALADLRTDEA